MVPMQTNLFHKKSRGAELIAVAIKVQHGTEEPSPGSSVASSKEQEEEEGRGALASGGWPVAAEPRQLLDPAYPSGEKRVDGWRWAGSVGRRQRARFDAPGSHVGQELVGDLGQHFLGQAGHAENVVTTSVNVVAERDKLGKKMGEANVRLDFVEKLIRHSSQVSGSYSETKKAR